MSRILVVDDEPGIRTLISAILTREGFEVEVAEDGNRALAWLDRATFDLMITDLIMPDKEGLETIRDVRARLPHLPVIAVSGGGRMSPTDYLQTAQLLGANATLAKPFTRVELLETVRALLAAA